MPGLQYRLVIKDNQSGQIEYDNWFNTDADRRTNLEQRSTQQGKSYLVEEKEVPPFDSTDPPSGEWRAL